MTVGLNDHRAFHGPGGGNVQLSTMSQSPIFPGIGELDAQAGIVDSLRWDGDFGMTRLRCSRASSPVISSRSKNHGHNQRR
jgi:hypothetical protein